MPRVLFVDDELDICDVVALYLRERGFATVTAGRGATARELLTKEPFDLVIVDAVLPDVRGLELASLARARAIPVLIVSGNAAAIERNAELERYPLLEKPFHLAALDAAVRGILDGEAASRRPIAESTP